MAIIQPQQACIQVCHQADKPGAVQNFKPCIAVPLQADHLTAHCPQTLVYTTNGGIIGSQHEVSSAQSMEDVSHLHCASPVIIFRQLLSFSRRRAKQSRPFNKICYFLVIFNAS